MCVHTTEWSITEGAKEGMPSLRMMQKTLQTTQNGIMFVIYESEVHAGYRERWSYNVIMDTLKNETQILKYIHSGIWCLGWKKKSL